MLSAAEDEQLSAEIDNINRQIENLKNITEESIQILEEKKRQIRAEADPNASFGQDGDPEGKRLSANDLDTILGEIDREISRIQAEYDVAIADLQQKQKFLVKQSSSVEKLNSLINVLTYKIFDTQYEYRKTIEEKLQQKEEVSNVENMIETEKALQLAELDKAIADCKNTQESLLSSLDGQRMELQREMAVKMKTKELVLEALKRQHHTILIDLENKKLGAPTSSEKEIDRRIFELNKMLERDIENLKHLQETDSITTEERIGALLQERGLKLTKSGNFITSSGNRITRSVASCLGLLEGLDLPAWNIYPSPDDKADTTMSPPETLSTVTEDTESTESDMSSDDIDYLKVALGKVLTLALAEITTKQPRDPIHYLGHWLFKYRYNQEIDLIKKREIQELIEERERLEKQKLHMMIEEEARAAVINMVIRAEEEAIRRELERIAREASMYEDEEYEYEARDVLGEYKGPTAGQQI